MLWRRRKYDKQSVIKILKKYFQNCIQVRIDIQYENIKILFLIVKVSKKINSVISNYLFKAIIVNYLSLN